MEKLILRGVMWGADKIPDSVFDKIPGGYYKAKEENEKRQSAEKRKHHRRRDSRRRRSEDPYDDRRHHSDYEDDGDAGYRSDGHRGRSHKDRRSNLDGEDDYDPINNRPRRPRSRVMRDEYDDNDAYDDRHGGRHGHERDSRYEDPRMNGRAPYPEHSGYPDRGPIDRPPMGPGAPLAGAAAGGAAYMAHSNSQSTPLASPSPVSNSGVSSGYVPYANIYGQPLREDSPRQAFSPPPPSVNSSVQPNSWNQVSHPVAKQSYQQNPFAQEAAPGSQPSYTPDPYYNPRNYDDRYDAAHEYDRYDANGRSPNRYASPPGRHRRDDSRDSYDSRSDDRGSSHRRPRSPRRNDNNDDRAKSQGGRARERYVDYHHPRQSSVRERERYMPPPPPPKSNPVFRKKHDQRHETYSRDGTYQRGEEKQRSRREAEEGSRSE